MPDVYEEELANSREMLARVRAAINTVLAGGTQYSLDSGQTRQSVTRSTLTELRNMRNDLMREISAYEKRASDAPSGGAVYVRPGF